MPPAKKKKSAATKKVSSSKASKKESALHYNKEDLLKDYTQTFHIMLYAVAVVIGIGLLYFFAMATYLGGWSHNPYTPFVQQFGDRIEIESNSDYTVPVHGE